VAERSHYEAMADIQYAIRLQLLHERMFRRAKGIATVIAILATSSAFAGVFEALRRARPVEAGYLIIGAGIVLALLGAIDIVFDLSGKAWQHCHQRKRYGQLAARAQSLKLAKLDAEIASVAVDDLPEIEALRVPAFNDVQRSLGHGSNAKKLTLVQWLAAMVA